MTKATVTRLFLGSVIAFVAGAILAVAAVWVAIANGVFVMNGPDIVVIQSSTLAWALLGLAATGAIVAMGAMVAYLVSCIGALLNTAQLESKVWFIALLLLGIFNFGFLAMIAYVIAGPDGTRRPATTLVADAPA